MSVTDTGIDELFAGLRVEASAAGTYELELSNPAEYASFVQDIEGVFVIDLDHLTETVEAGIRELLGADVPLSREYILLALDKAGYDEIAWLKSLTGASTADGRGLHPGFWADDTTQLVNGYEHDPRYRG